MADAALARKTQKTYTSPLAKNAAVREAQVRAATAGDVADLVRSVEGTIWETVNHFGKGFSKGDLEDMHAAGVVGAVVAAGKYDVAHANGASFNTYATYWIRAHVVREAFFFWGKGRCKISTATSRVFHGYGKARRSLEARGVDPTPEAVAEILDVVVPVVRDAVAATTVPDRGFDEPIHDTSSRRRTSLSLSEVVADDNAEDALDALCRRARDGEVREAIEALDERDRDVIEKRFFEGRILRDVADDLRVSRARVQQIEKRAIERLSKALRRRGELE